MIGFSAPWILAGLILLPAIWFFLRVTPPLPKRAVFPPIRLLDGLSQDEETPSGTPWWLILIRLGAAGLLIAALAGPQMNGTLRFSHQGPLILFVDDGWTAAHDWEARKSLAAEAVRLAGDRNRPVMVVRTSAPDTGFTDQGTAMRAVETMKPMPWRTERKTALARLAKLKPMDAEILWLTDGIDDGKAEAALRTLKRLGGVRIFRDRPEHAPLAIAVVANTLSGLEATVRRAGSAGKRNGQITAYGRDGETLSTAKFVFASGESGTHVRLDLPLEMRNKTARLTIEGEKSAGAVRLFDRGAPRRAVGIVATGSDDEKLLSGRYYLERALGPFADVQSGDVAALLARKPSMLVLSDVGKIDGLNRTALIRFVEDGGILLRFAGEHMAAGSDDLVPVALRSGGRALGGALTWAAPQTLAPFPTSSPFGGLAVPADVAVSKQILAEPSIELSQHTWARLTDGTPMVTANRRGRGWIVLFHVTAGPEWSSLPLSGLYVDMLRRLLPLAAGTDPAELSADASLAPASVLDGFGRMHRAGSELAPIKAAKLAETVPSARHPPGLYGSREALRALNAASDDETLPSMILSGTETYTAHAAHDLAPPLFVAAAILLLIDFLLSLVLRGYAPDFRRLIHFLLPALLILPLWPPSARADDAFALKAALDTRLAYVVTGAADTDAMSRAGLIGLGRFLHARTSYEPQDPMAVDLERDPLDFFPLIYWPMEPREKNLSPNALGKLSAYLRQGGTLLIDTRDLTLGPVRGDTSAGQRTLRRLVGALDLPPLQPVPVNHVLTKTFYLLRDFPGRWAGGRVWVASGLGGDAVSPVIVGDADWAAAWATDGQGRFLADPSPGGDRQREMAIRFGINVVMYALTGNYKTDQIHVPAILKRLGK
jgi:hypothetical protein